MVCRASESNVAFEAIEGYCRAHIYLIVKSRLDRVLARLPPSANYRLCWALARLLCRSVRGLKEEIGGVLRDCYPGLAPGRAERMAVEHVAHVIFNMTAFPALVAASADEFERFFDYREFEAVLEQSERRMVIVAATHFYSHVSMLLLSELFHRRGISACATFQLKEHARVAAFISRVKTRCHHDFHVSLNVAERSRAHTKALKEYLCRQRGAVVIYGDFRSGPSARDLRFEVGGQSFFANGGLKYVLDHAPAESVVMPYRLEFSGGRFTTRTGPALRLEQACQRYYQEILPAHVTAGAEQWQLWFLARALLSSPREAA
jgi:hypothetical protein